jgi:hypothetical protein
MPKTINEKYAKAIKEMNRQFKKSGIMFSEVPKRANQEETRTREHNCERCNFSVEGTNQFLHIEWCRDRRIYEKLCLKCVKEV